MGNQNGTVLPNNASVRYTDPESGVITINDPTPPTVTVVEPVLAVAKAIVLNNPSPPVVGTVTTYRITVNHAAGSASTAYDTRITDFVPAGLTLNLSSISWTLTGGATVPTNNSVGQQRGPGRRQHPGRWQRRRGVPGYDQLLRGPVRGQHGDRAVEHTARQ